MIRLLNARTITLEEFFESTAPLYAILSHTWGNEEVNFQDIQEPAAACTKKAGYDKIVQTCRQAIKDGLDYVWVDTCCIDKSSSAELSEAINSMFRWYEKAQVCYAFLVDVPPHTDPDDRKAFFSGSRWFTRGWTLQELLAPREVVFFASDWLRIATKGEMADEISAATGIDRLFLGHESAYDTAQEYLKTRVWPPRRRFRRASRQSTGLSMNQASIAERMSWASYRQTTRTEDMAYCLLGIFGINMPLIYGEGERAFIRLQEEILKRSDDQSLFAWGSIDLKQRQSRSRLRPSDQLHHDVERSGILALSPAAFRDCGCIISCKVDERASQFSITNKGLTISLPLSRDNPPYALLQCRNRDDPTTLLALPVILLQENIYDRAEGEIKSVDQRTWKRWSMKAIYLPLESQPDQKRWWVPDYSVFVRSIPYLFSIKDTFPQTQQTLSTRLIKLKYPTSHLTPRETKTLLLLATKDEGLEIVFILSLLTIRFKDDRNSLHLLKTSSLLTRMPHNLTLHDLAIGCHITGTEITALVGASNHVLLGDSVLHTSVSLQNVLKKPHLVIDIRLSSNYLIILWFRMKGRLYNLIGRHLDKTLSLRTSLYIRCVVYFREKSSWASELLCLLFIMLFIPSRGYLEDLICMIWLKCRDGVMSVNWGATTVFMVPLSLSVFLLKNRTSMLSPTLLTGMIYLIYQYIVILMFPLGVITWFFATASFILSYTLAYSWESRHYLDYLDRTWSFRILILSSISPYIIWLTLSYLSLDSLLLLSFPSANFAYFLESRHYLITGRNFVVSLGRKLCKVLDNLKR